MPYSITVSQTITGTNQILLIINVNTREYNPVTIDAKSKGAILNLFIKTGKHTDIILWSINATTTGSDLVSYRYQSEANHLDTNVWPINATTTGSDLVSYRYQSEANHLDTIVWPINATSVFEVYVLQNKVNR